MRTSRWKCVRWRRPNYHGGRASIDAFRRLRRSIRSAALLCVAIAPGCDRAQPAAETRAQPQTPPTVWSLSREVSQLLVALGMAGSVVGADRASLALAPLAGAVDLGLAGEDCLLLTQGQQPELAILQGDARGHELADALEQRGIRTAVLEPRSANEVLEAVQRLGTLMHRETRASALAARIASDVGAIAVRRDGRTRLVVAWLVQRDPPVVVGATGLLHELLELAGAENAVHAESGERVALEADVSFDRTPEVWLDSTSAPLEAPPLGLAEGARQAVPPELAQLPALDLVERVTRLHALLYP